MEKYENISKFLSNIDGLLGFIFSIPWWVWLLILVLLIGREAVLDLIFIELPKAIFIMLPKAIIIGVPKSLWQIAKSDFIAFITLIAAEIGVITLMVFAYKEPGAEKLKQPLIYVLVAIFLCFSVWQIIVDLYGLRERSNDQSSK